MEEVKEVKEVEEVKERRLLGGGIWVDGGCQLGEAPGRGDLAGGWKDGRGYPPCGDGKCPEAEETEGDTGVRWWQNEAGESSQPHPPVVTESVLKFKKMKGIEAFLQWQEKQWFRPGCEQPRTRSEQAGGRRGERDEDAADNHGEL